MRILSGIRKLLYGTLILLPAVSLALAENPIDQKLKEEKDKNKVGVYLISMNRIVVSTQAISTQTISTQTVSTATIARDTLPEIYLEKKIELCPKKEIISLTGTRPASPSAEYTPEEVHFEAPPLWMEKKRMAPLKLNPEEPRAAILIRATIVSERIEPSQGDSDTSASQPVIVLNDLEHTLGEKAPDKARPVLTLKELLKDKQ